MQTEAETLQLKRRSKKKESRDSRGRFSHPSEGSTLRVCAAALPLCPSESNLHAAAMETSDGECDPRVTSAFIVFTQAGNVLMGTAAKARTSASINKRSW